MRDTFLRDFHFRFSERGMFKSTFNVDWTRLVNSLTSIARGLYYHHTWHTHKAMGPMEIAWDAAKDKEAALKALSLSDQEYEAFTNPLTHKPKCAFGANTEVFQYDFDLRSNPKYVVCTMRFYEGQAISVRWENGQREYRTSLKSVKDYFDKYPEIKILDPADILDGTKADLLGQLGERDAQLAIVMKDAKHQRDFAAFTLARMIRSDISKKKTVLNGASDTKPIRGERKSIPTD